MPLTSDIKRRTKPASRSMPVSDYWMGIEGNYLCGYNNCLHRADKHILTYSKAGKVIKIVCLECECKTWIDSHPQIV
jgi:hypothetical protein